MKAILVIDLPNICSNCLLEQNVVINHKNYSYCGACGITTRHGQILHHCPLKSMPRKMAVEHRWFSEDFARGYNLCIDEILGEVHG